MRCLRRSPPRPRSRPPRRPKRPQFNSRSIAAFTAAQADAGKDAYAKNCASCHGAQLGGSEFASALRGLTFSNNWGGKTAADLFTYMSTKMPPASPGSLDAATYARIIAFLLQSNGQQPTTKELPTDPRERSPR